MSKPPEKLLQLLTSGKTLEECSREYNVTRQTIHNWKKKYFPHLTRDDFGKGVQGKTRREAKKTYLLSRYGKENWHHADYFEKATRAFFQRKRQNSKNKKWEFTVTYNDIEWNTHCPILGLEIDWTAEYRKETSPSLDRINPRMGYVPGNVVIVCWRANRIKNDGSAEEHQKIADFLRNRGI